MLKKIILWTLFAGFTGLLVFGAINRTTAKIENDDGSQVNQTVERENKGSLENGSKGNDYGQHETTPSQPHQTGENDFSAKSEIDKTSNHGNEERKTTKHEWEIIEGAISKITAQEMLVKADTGQQTLVARRPWRFALEQGFTAQMGDQIKLDGFYEEEEYKVALITNLTTGQTVHLRDETGHPLWASGEDH